MSLDEKTKRIQINRAFDRIKKNQNHFSNCKNREEKRHNQVTRATKKLNKSHVYNRYDRQEKTHEEIFSMNIDHIRADIL